MIPIISNVMSSVMDEHDGGESRTELELHANVVVSGIHATLLTNNWNMVYVSPFTPDYQDLERV